MSWGLAALIALALIVAFVVVGARKYRRLLAPEHLVELGEGLLRIKANAFASPLVEGSAPDPERHAFVSSAGAIVGYTVREEGGAHAHHLSLSYRGGPLAVGAAGTLIAFCARALGVPMEKLHVGRSERGVFHVGWELDGDAHAALEAAPVKVPSPEEAPAVMAACFEEARRLGPMARVAVVGQGGKS